MYEQVEEYYEQERERQCATMPSVARYLGVKCWDRMGSDRAVMKGEVGMRGALVVERYLDDVQERLGSRLKVMCRAGYFGWLFASDEQGGVGAGSFPPTR